MDVATLLQEKIKQKKEERRLTRMAEAKKSRIQHQIVKDQDDRRRELAYKRDEENWQRG
jgi:Flp pilus assembly protein TadB